MLPQPVITISTEGVEIAGENFGLSCTVTVIDGLTDDAALTIFWTDDSGGRLSGGSYGAGTQVPLATTTNLTFSYAPLLTSHGGRYICIANLSVSNLSMNRSASSSIDLTVNSK